MPAKSSYISKAFNAAANGSFLCYFLLFTSALQNTRHWPVMKENEDFSRTDD